MSAFPPTQLLNQPNDKRLNFAFEKELQNNFLWVNFKEMVKLKELKVSL